MKQFRVIDDHFLNFKPFFNHIYENYCNFV